MYPNERPASRTGRDRDVLPEPSGPGPYESPYDTRCGYQQPLTRRRVRGEPAMARLMPREGEPDVRSGPEIPGPPATGCTAGPARP